jgi:hypothetical protein
MGEPTVVFIAGSGASLREIQLPVHGGGAGESSLVPPNNRLRQDEQERVFPSRPEAARNDPKELVEWTQSGLRMLAFQEGELLAEGKIL